MAKQEFQTEVSQLLQLIVHSLYSHPEIFLRELISNASDALDKLRHLCLTEDKYKALVGNGIDSPRINLELDEGNKKLTISDTGIGMNKEDLISHLGTVARSGTKGFLTQLSGDARKDSNLIGQFGVGFYSVFMVANRVEVISRKAGEEKTYKWTSDGTSGFDIEEVSRDDAKKTAGTAIHIHFNEEGSQYANGWRLQEIVRKYSNHIAFPIFLTYDKRDWDAEKKESIKTCTTEQVNAASAMWRRPKSELSDHDYKELYQSLVGQWEDPLFWLHTHAEGTLDYALSRWRALSRYIDDGGIEMDNSAAERALRTVALGRKNYLFAGSDAGGERAATIYGLLGTAKLNGLDPELYLRHVLERIAEHPVNRVQELLPWTVAAVLPAHLAPA